MDIESTSQPRTAPLRIAMVSTPWFEVPPGGYGGIEAGQVDEDTKRDLLARARALLFPIRWDEPFGLVMIEAMAAGTPVLAFRRGSVPEVVLDGVTGVIVDRPEELVEAIPMAADFDPQACRDHVQQRFSTDSMVDRYESLFSELARQASSEAPVPVA